jgi:hypothetical protein
MWAPAVKPAMYASAIGLTSVQGLSASPRSSSQATSPARSSTGAGSAGSAAIRRSIARSISCRSTSGHCCSFGPCVPAGPGANLGRRHIGRGFPPPAFVATGLCVAFVSPRRHLSPACPLTFPGDPQQHPVEADFDPRPGTASIGRPRGRGRTRAASTALLGIGIVPTELTELTEGVPVGWLCHLRQFRQVVVGFTSKVGAGGRPTAGAGSARRRM